VTTLLSRLHRRSPAAVALVALAVFASTACVKQKSPGVAIKRLKADIVFGLNPPAAAPPSVAPPIDLGNFGIELPQLPKLPSLPKLPGAECRVAGITDAPEREAQIAIVDQPAVGSYRWRFNGVIKLNGVDIPTGSQFFTRVIHDVTKVEESTTPVGGDPANTPRTTKTFSYSLRTDLNVAGVSAGVQDATYQVKDNPPRINVNPATQIPVAGGGLGKQVIVGDPERGITLKALLNKDANGETVSTFNPNPGVLLLPLPVNPGETFQSVGVDPTNGAVLIHDGEVVKRDFVDACGDLIQGWAVASRQTFVNPAGGATVAQYDYMFAPQYGGMLIFERLSPPDVSNTPLPEVPLIPGSPTPNIPSPPTTLPPLPVALPAISSTFTYSIAQLHPTPAK
jgi:hypothetical protein